MRRKFGVEHGDDQGSLVQAARERIREQLRARRPFVWDSTNLTVDQRGRILSLAHAYGARTRIVSVERGMEETRRANADREEAVPEAAWEAIVARWTPPTLAEAHEMVIHAPHPAPRPGRGG